MKKILTLFSGLMLTVALAFGQNYNYAHGYYGNFNSSAVKLFNSPDNNGGVFTAMYAQDSVNLDPQQPTSYTMLSGGGGVAISRIDASGNLVFSQVVEASYYGYYHVFDIQTISDGSFYLIASIRNAPYPFDIDPSAGVHNINNNCVAISHFDAMGNLISVKELNIETYNFEIFETTLSTSDELIICGSFSYGAHFSDVTGQDSVYAGGDRTVFTAKYDENLILDWVDYFENDKPIQYSTFNYGNVIIKPNGKVVTALAIGSTVTLANTNTYSPSGYYDAILIEYDENGAIINDFVLSTSGDDDYINTMAADANNNIAVLGHMRNTIDIDITGTNTGATNVQYAFFAIYDDAFNLKDFKTGSMGNSRPKDCKFNSNGELVVAGRLFGTFDFDFETGGDQFYRLDAYGNNYDVFLAKYDTSLNVIYAHNIGNASNYGDVEHLRMNSGDDIFISGKLGGGLTDMNFGPLTNEVDGYSTPYGFVAKYELCNTQETVNNVTICPGDSYTFPDGFTQNNITVQVTRDSRYTGVSSCDSVIVTNVNLYPVYSFQDNATICSGDSYTYHDGTVQNNITSTVVHTSNLQTVNGCDSIVETTVTVNQLAQTNESQEVCNGGSYTFPDGTVENNITTQMVHNSTLQTVNGCDSVIKTTVDVINVDTVITQNVNILTVNQVGATYQWYDCGSSQQLNGEDQQAYEITTSGDYQVEVTYNGCTVTSSCISVIFTGIEQVEGELAVSLYPNPTSGRLTVNFSDNKNIELIRLYNIEGKEMLVENVMNSNKVELDITNFKAGVYFLKVISKDQTSSFKILKN
jgi:hypothetical protein